MGNDSQSKPIKVNDGSVLINNGASTTKQSSQPQGPTKAPIPKSTKPKK
ncbi:hypothetical protein N9R76_07195 [Planktomarina temperata]|nr:hypothetical protein [Planktomarina temperata]